MKKAADPYGERKYSEMPYTEEKIYHLKDYVEYVSELGNRLKIEAKTPPVLWFRGQQKQSYQLRPSLVREMYGKAPQSSEEMPIQEEMRYQHYLAKNYHFLDKNPETQLDWMGLMQHHSVKTRLLDWSESMFHPLIFALECFFDREKYKTYDRIYSSPHVWVFEPIEWNRKAIENILQSDKIINECIKSIIFTGRSYRHVRKKFYKKMRNLKTDIPSRLQTKKTRHLEGIFNLSTIEKRIENLGHEELLSLLANGEEFECLFYVLYQVYLTSKKWELDKVMPLAVVESYHSERIRAQRGAFTIFPYYKDEKKMKRLRKVDIFLDAMENMGKGNQFLHKIRICNQEEIAFEVMNAGMNSSWLYPEMPVVANTIENRDFNF